ncbi:hypothetical protein CTEN210_12047 [Chaetoceros tenuissimus]|uniref:Uncharacterized protein n=1 Tax=Chaetoceros tenuissimus TaxID=426638 RepID=A0AAD3D0G6_9STRA|nr:hypothetical protein CTEN210_12047 [Chaetoceros tenuissimus]
MSKAITAFNPSPARKAIFSIASVVLGLWTFKTVNEISGPAFEPILQACMDKSIPQEQFAELTGYHAYDPYVGLKIFDPLVCLITQFLLELRETFPAGLFVWMSIITIALPLGMTQLVEAGRSDTSKKSPIYYPIIIGLLGQLFGISVIFPLIWVPSYIFGCGYGPATLYRFNFLVPILIPTVALSLFVFIAPTETQWWTVSAGILGGPIPALGGMVYWNDKNTIPTTAKSLQDNIKNVKVYSRLLMPTAIFAWYALLFVTFDNLEGSLWDAIWTNAGPSVRFMTIDAGILYLAYIMWFAFHSEIIAIKVLLLTFVVGPGGAGLIMLGKLEELKANSNGIELVGDKKKKA